MLQPSAAKVEAAEPAAGRPTLGPTSEPEEEAEAAASAAEPPAEVATPAIAMEDLFRAPARARPLHARPTTTATSFRAGTSRWRCSGTPPDLNAGTHRARRRRLRSGADYLQCRCTTSMNRTTRARDARFTYMGKRGYWTKEQNKSETIQKRSLGATSRSLRGYNTVTSRSLRSYFAVTSRSQRGHFAVTMRSLRSLRGYYAVTTRSLRSLRGHYAVRNSTCSRLRKRSTSLQNEQFDHIVAVGL